MKRLLFIGFEFHRKTRSSDFLLRILEEKYEMEICYVDLYQRDCWDVLSQVVHKKVDILVCWQVMPPMPKLRKHLSFKHAAFFPMYDGCPSVKKPDRWFAYRGFQIICFCKTLAGDLRRVGLSAHGIQFFPPPPNSVKTWGDSKSVFFWNRREKINIQTVQQLFMKTEIDHLHVHKALDPDSRFIPPSTDCNWEISCSDWYDTREEMREDMLKSAFYIAPRLREGIGMSFLEAMANGRCVIAPDSSTMNEYIVHGQTGFLYNPDRPRALQIDDVKKIQRNVYRYMCEGYERWCCEREKILEWLEAPVKVHSVRLSFAMLRRFLRNPVKVVRVLGKEYSLKGNK